MKRSWGRIVAGAVVAAIGAFVLSGCRSAPKGDDGAGAAPTSPAPSFAEVAAIQEKRVSAISTYWAVASMEMTWKDEDGRKRTEIGDGRLILSLPHKTALTFEKVGEILFWAGSDEERFWLFEAGDEPTVRVARNDNFFDPQCEELNLPVHPLELVDLLGLFRYENPTGEIEGVSTPSGPAWQVTMPGRWSRRIVELDPKTLRPMRVQLADPATGEVFITSELSREEAMEVRGLSPSELPFVPTRVVLRGADPDSVIRIALRSPQDRTPQGPVRDAVFEFNAISRNMRPKKRIVLDATCANPAFAAEATDSR